MDMFQSVLFINENASAMLFAVIFRGVIMVKESGPVLMERQSHGVGANPWLLEA
jgi:hypothetical protein